MKVLFVSNDPSVFEEKSAARARMRAYADAIGELHIVSAVSHTDAREVVEGPLRLYPVRSGRLWRVPALAKRARALVRAQGIEVVSAQDPFEHGLAALRAVRGTGAKLHLQVHTDFLSPWFLRGRLFPSLLNRVRVRLAGRVLPKASGVRTVSERVRASIVSRYGTRVVDPTVIPVAVDGQVPFPTPLPPHAFTFALIAVGRLEPEKRLGDVLQALALLRSTYPVVGLFIAGEGREKSRLQKQVCRLKLEQCVVFLGSRPDAWALMQSAQCFIQASAYEGYGRTLIEAALAKVPIITTETGIVGEVFVPGRDVLVAPVGQPGMLARRIETLMEDQGVRASLAMQAEATAREHLASVGDVAEHIAADLART